MKKPTVKDVAVNRAYLHGQVSSAGAAKLLKLKHRHVAEARMARVARWRFLNWQLIERKP